MRGSTTTKEKIALLEPEGIEPYYLKLDPQISGDDVTTFFDVDTVVLNIPPPRVEDRVTFMRKQADELVSYINASPVKRLIMVSSTGVYGFKNQDADESNSHPPETENGRGLVTMERQLLDGLRASVAVLRMSGLIGPGRNPGRFLSGRIGNKRSGKKQVDKDGNQHSSQDQYNQSHKISGNGDEPVNLIHLEDACGVIITLIEQPDITGIFNTSAKEHPSRKEFYSRAAEKLGFDPPKFADAEPRPWKRIISEKIRRKTGYRFVYDNPIDALDAM